MFKRLLTLVLAFLFLLPACITTFAANPASVEAPVSLNAYDSDGSIMVRWTLPKSLVTSLEDPYLDGQFIYCIDYRVDNGAWHYASATVDENTYGSDENLTGYVENITRDENNTQQVFLIPEHLGLSGDFDYVNHSYSFRVRLAFDDYDTDGAFLVSAYSSTASLGKNASVPAMTKLDAPTGLKVVVKYSLSGSPYFQLDWTNPQSVSVLNQYYPITYKVDFKVGDGKWFSETTTHDWWGASSYASTGNFDPIEKEMVDKIVIEGNTYAFRVLYAYEPVTGTKIYSGFSNVAYAGIKPYETGTNWAMPFLDSAFELGIISDRLMGKRMSDPITREEFAEIAVLFYEMVTGEEAVPADNTFLDTTNPEILKAFALKITSGVGDGTKFEPNGKLSRQQMATMITNTLRACYPTIALDIIGQPDFKDQTKFAKYAINPAKFMARYGITVGDGKGSFDPISDCTREQAITFLVKAFEFKDKYTFR